MSVYHGAAVAVLAHAGMVSGLIGIALWPGLFLHAVLLVWTMLCLRAPLK